MQIKLIRTAAVTAAMIGMLAALSNPASALPVFARKYGFDCTMCHSDFPRLNDFGQRYRANGYQLPGRENEERTILESPTPLALRTSAGINYNKFKESAWATDVKQFQINGLDLLSGGLIAENIGYLVVYPPHITASRGVVGQDGTIEMANVIFSNFLNTRWLNLRVGRFEPAYVAFSVKRSLTFSPYEIYDFAFAGGSPLSETQEGVELTGFGKCGLSYAAGAVNGSGTNGYDTQTPDFYLRIAKVFGAGEGQTAGQRIGLTGYFGQAVPDTSVAASSADERKTFIRFGVDMSLNYRLLNLGLQYLMERDSRELWGLEDTPVIHGGFAELSVLPTTRFVGFARYDLVDTPEEIDLDITRFTLGGRYYFQTNLACHLEFSHRVVKHGGDAGEDAVEDYVTTRLDFAF